MLGDCANKVEETALIQKIQDLGSAHTDFCCGCKQFLRVWIFSSDDGICQMSYKVQFYLWEMNQLIPMGGSF